jgi:steroid 5-alpha reductase family enzyme
MVLLIDVLLMLAAWLLLTRSLSERDEVWALCLRMLSVAAVLAVITNERGQPISLLLFLCALWLPGAKRYEQTTNHPVPPR